jgi:hypothetical protein
MTIDVLPCFCSSGSPLSFAIEPLYCPIYTLPVSPSQWSDILNVSYEAVRGMYYRRVHAQANVLDAHDENESVQAIVKDRKKYTEWLQLQRSESALCERLVVDECMTQNVLDGHGIPPPCPFTSNE